MLLILLTALAWADCELPLGVGMDLQTQATHCPLPVALDASESTLCLVDLAIDAGGAAVPVFEACDHPGARSAANDALNTWTFTPADGRSNRFRVLVTYDDGAVSVNGTRRTASLSQALRQSRMGPPDREWGVEGGVEGYNTEGVEGGVVGGVIGGELHHGGVRTFHHSEIQAKKRVMPKYPDAAKSLNLGNQRCMARVFIDEKGVPYQVRIDRCPKVFAVGLEPTLMQWRWYPAKVDGQRVKAQFLIAVNYKLQ